MSEYGSDDSDREITADDKDSEASLTGSDDDSWAERNRVAFRNTEKELCMQCSRVPKYWRHYSGHKECSRCKEETALPRGFVLGTSIEVLLLDKLTGRHTIKATGTVVENRHNYDWDWNVSAIKLPDGVVVWVDCHLACQVDPTKYMGWPLPVEGSLSAVGSLPALGWH